MAVRVEECTVKTYFQLSEKLWRRNKAAEGLSVRRTESPAERKAAFDRAEPVKDAARLLSAVTKPMSYPALITLTGRKEID